MDKKKSLFEIHTAVLLFGLAGLFGKWLILSPFIIVLGRVFFASITLALLLRFSKQSIKISPRKNYLYLIFLGLILAVHWVSFFKSIQISTVAVGLLSFATYPVFTTFLEPLLLKEKIVKMNISFSLFCVAGVFLIIPSFGLDNSTFVGVLWGLLSSITFAVLTILNRKLTQHFSSLLIAFYQDFFAMLFLLPFYFVLRPALNTNDILLLCVLGVFCTAGSHTLFIKGMKRIKAQTASMIHFLEPVYGIIFAFFFLHEIPSLRIILGGAIILWGQILIILRIFKKRKKDEHKV
ncbi:MAG: DMT family transporter [Candidatus Aminicenantes bacterium]|nr:DMT family transporter [Candidatus Aminicenantes bacterium]